MPGRSLSRERSGTHYTGGWVGPRAGLDRRRKSRLHRDSIPGPSSPQPVAIATTLPARTYVQRLLIIRRNSLCNMCTYVYLLYYTTSRCTRHSSPPSLQLIPSNTNVILRLNYGLITVSCTSTLLQDTDRYARIFVPNIWSRISTPVCLSTDHCPRILSFLSRQMVNIWNSFITVIL